MNLTLYQSARLPWQPGEEERARSAGLVQGRWPSGPLHNAAGTPGLTSWFLQFSAEGARKCLNYGLVGVMVSIYTQVLPDIHVF